jgi:hypothetical protein
MPRNKRFSKDSRSPHKLLTENLLSKEVQMPRNKRFSKDSRSPHKHPDREPLK